MHSGKNNLNDAVYNYLLEKGEKIQDQSFKVHHLHRLDKETKGLCIYAKTRAAFQYLDKQFKNKEVVKKYIAVVSKPKDNLIDKTPFKVEKNYVIEDGWVRLTNDKSMPKMSIIIEETEQIEIKGRDYLVHKIKAVTGRKHQIRILLSYLGQPIEGDKYFNLNNHSDNLMLFSKELNFAKREDSPLGTTTFSLDTKDIKDYAIQHTG